MADLQTLRSLVDLAAAGETYLSLYLNTAGESVPRNIQARALDLIEGAAAAVEGGPWAKAFRTERERVAGLLTDLKPTGPGLLLFSSEEAGRLEEWFLPSPVQDHVRVGPGLDVLPLMDALDEHEPVVVAFVEKERSRIVLVGAGRVMDAEHEAANVPGRSKAGGWAATRHQRHAEAHWEHHLRDSAEDLRLFLGEHPSNRVVLGGPTEALGFFRNHLHSDVAGRVVGELHIDAHATDAAIAAQVLPLAEAAEREGESKLVDELITRAEKNAGAVAGLGAALHALNDHNVDVLVLDPEVPQPARYCPACDLLWGQESITCPRCDGATTAVEGRQELPRHVLRQQLRLELVHGAPAEKLRGHGGAGAILRVAHH